VHTSFTRPSGSLAPRQYKLHHTTPHIQRCIPMLPPLIGRPIEQPSATLTRLWRATARSAPCQCHTTNGLRIVNPCILASVPDRKPPLQLRSAAAAMLMYRTYGWFCRYKGATAQQKLGCTPWCSSSNANCTSQPEVTLLSHACAQALRVLSRQPTCSSSLTDLSTVCLRTCSRTKQPQD
jgi:hypothetical protein